MTRMARPHDPVAFVERVYDLDAPEPAWLRSMAEGAIGLFRGSQGRAMCFRIDMSQPAEPVLGRMVAVGFPAGVEAALMDFFRAEPAKREIRALFSARKVTTTSEQFGGSVELTTTSSGKFIRSNSPSSVDAFICVAIDAEGRGVTVGVPLPRVTTLSGPLRGRWSLLGAHIAAACRLRSRAPDRAREECILSPSGRALHAEGSATALSARERLREAVARDRARTQRPRAEPDQALALWPGLVSAAGRWSTGADAHPRG